MKFGDFAWYLGREVFVGHTVSAEAETIISTDLLCCL